MGRWVRARDPGRPGNGPAASCRTPTLTAMPGQVFVSYVPADSPYVEALRQHLGARGLSVWPDQRCDVFDPLVQQAIDGASTVVVVQTAASLASPAAGLQVQYAVSRGKPLLVLLRDNTAAPTLPGAHVVDVRNGALPGDDTVAWLHQLGQWQAARLAPASAAAPATGAGRGRLAWILGGVVAVLLVVCLAAVVAVVAWPRGQTTSRTWQEQAADIPGIIVYLDPDSPAYNETVLNRLHEPGVLSYPMSPPAGGPHNPRWQNCMGDVYPAEIAKEHAVHSLEHGAVWVTYRPDLPPDQVAALASKVDGVEFTMLSPFPGLDAPISLQAWGYQLKVDQADDKRIDRFITVLRRNASLEPGASCSGGITETSPVPFDV